MSYSLGIDLGTTASAVATNEGGGVAMATVGHQSLVIPSVVHLSTDGEIVVGEAAERRGIEDPAGLAREFKRRFGDPQPLILNGSPVAANDLMLAVATHLVGSVARHRDEAPDEIVVCHPANWGEYKVSLLSDTLANSSLPPHRLISEPAAAAVHDASQDKVADGSIICVYDLGGGTFDVALLRKLADGWENVGKPGGIERLGGIDFDSAVLHHVVTSLALDLTTFDADDPSNQRAMTRLKEECKRAKHSLSEDTSATIPVLLPGISHDVRITRSEFESLIDPAISRTLDALDVTVNASPINMTDIDRVLLVGGSSQIPLVHQRVLGHTQVPVATDRHPKHAIALGAAASLSAATETVAIAEAIPDPSVPASDGPPLRVDDLYALPHISEAPLPDFMQRRTPGATPSQATTTPAAPTPPTAPAASETPAPTTDPTPTPPAPGQPAPAAPPAAPVAPPVQPPTPAAQPPTMSQPQTRVQPTASSARPQPAPAATPYAEQPQSKSKAGFWVLVAAVLAVAGGLTYLALASGDDGQTASANDTNTTDATQAPAATTTDTTTDTAADDSTTATTTGTDATAATAAPAETTSTAGDAGLPVGDPCPAESAPDPSVRYRVAEIPDDEIRATLNGRNIPSTGSIDGVASEALVEFPEFSELNINYDLCSMNGSRPWWAVNVGDTVVWSSTLFIEPVPG